MAVARHWDCAPFNLLISIALRSKTSPASVNMLSRVSRSALSLARRNATAPRFAQVAFFSTEETDVQKAVKSELAPSPKVQTVLDQILELNMMEIAELSFAIQVME